MKPSHYKLNLHRHNQRRANFITQPAHKVQKQRKLNSQHKPQSQNPGLRTTDPISYPRTTNTTSSHHKPVTQQHVRTHSLTTNQNERDRAEIKRGRIGCITETEHIEPYQQGYKRWFLYCFRSNRICWLSFVFWFAGTQRGEEKRLN